ncbi:MAG: trigger factor [Candidatus Omnitrophica bacterium]|nr:trigger factor [Candidatus Omnitrophota bacterium]
MTLDLKITLKETAPCQKELRVEVPAAQVQEELERVYQELKRVVSVPGFRVGHAPRDLLERHHGTKAKEETLSRLIGRTLDEALAAQAAMDLVGRPRVSDIQWQPQQPLSFVAHLEVAPEVPLGRYRGLKLSRPKVGVTEESVARVLEHLRETHSELRPVLEPRAAAAGDFLLADLTAQGGAKPGQPPQRQREVVIHLDLEKDADGILRPLIGVKPGESRTVALKDGGSLLVEAKQIKAREVPPLDDSFARTVGPYESLEKLNEAIRQDLERQARGQQRQHLESQALGHLGQDWALEVPPSLVASQARRILKERAVELMNQGVPPAQVQGQAQALTDQAKVDALKQVKLYFILRRIAAAEGFTASEQEVEERVRALAARLGTPERELRKELEEKDLLEEIAWGVVRKKVLDLIIKEAEIS